MAIEPQVFIFYGRPDKDAAHALACEFGNLPIETDVHGRVVREILA